MYLNFMLMLLPHRHLLVTRGQAGCRTDKQDVKLLLQLFAEVLKKWCKVLFLLSLPLCVPTRTCHKTNHLVRVHGMNSAST